MGQASHEPAARLASTAGSEPVPPILDAVNEGPAERGRRRAAVVVNPSKVDIKVLRSVVAAAESTHGLAPSTWHETSAKDDGRGASAAAIASAPSVILVAGGDGTLRVAAEAIASTGIPLGLVPAGTGNLFARALGLPLGDLKRSVDIACSGRDQVVDVGQVSLGRSDGTNRDEVFLVMAGIGLDAHMAGHTNERLKRRIGWLAYSDPIARSIIGNRQFDLHYRLDDRPEAAARAHTIIVGNSGTLTGGVLLLPEAVVDDGLLDAVMLRPGKGPGWGNIGYRLTFNRMLHRTRFGRLVGRFSPKARAISYAQARTMHLRLEEPQEIQLDGDSHGSVISVSLTNLHHALIVRVPSGPAARPGVR
ncbi:transcriptional regulator [Plantibacter flavus]|nr:transcriptional regulator [Plantibacter flavus]